MPVVKLQPHLVEKPWGRLDLTGPFSRGDKPERPVGEIWFQEPGDTTPELLIKYLFTSEKLSVQVHPDDRRARERGLPRGKDECWLILDADRDSTIALGPKEPMTHDELRQAAEDGTIEQKLWWKPVQAGDFLYAPSGTVHAIGAGLSLIEIQQKSETTYRLYDYGRPRELHLDDGIAVSDGKPYEPIASAVPASPGRMILVEGPTFVLERWARGGEIALPDGEAAWLVPVSGRGELAGVTFQQGECLKITGTETVEADGPVDLLLAYVGDTRFA